MAWEPEDAMKQLGFDDKIVKAVADATVNTPVWSETDRGVWSDEQILQAFYEKAPEYKKEIDLFWNHLELAIKQFSYTKRMDFQYEKRGACMCIFFLIRGLDLPENKRQCTGFLAVDRRSDFFLYSEADQTGS